MEKHSKKKRWMITGISVTLALASVCMVVCLYMYQKNSSMRNARYVLRGEISKLQYAIDSQLFTTKALEVIVTSNHGEAVNFDKAAESLYEKDASIRSLQLAPDGNVTYVYPLEGNEEAFGDLFSDPDRKTEAEYARDTGKMTLAGPYELSQGGMGIVARNPIYLTDENGQKTFWGFSIVVLNVPEIFDEINLKALNGQGYKYKIWRIHPDTGKVQNIIQNADFSVTDAVEDVIQVPNGTWHLSIIPKKGWVPMEYIWIESIVCSLILVLAVMVINGILTSAEQKKELAKLVNTDPLTGLHNGRYFMNCLKEFVLQNRPCVLYYLDMDRFKQINDRFGHDIGDKFLKESAARMQKCLSEEDLAFRTGGDEFTVLAAGGKGDEFYEKLKERLKEEIGRPYILSECTLHPHVSIGYARYPEEQENAEALIRQADQRMYEEKRQIHH